MGAFDRLTTILKAQGNKLMEFFEGDGIAVMEQNIIDAKKEYAQAKVSAAEIRAEVKRYENKRDESTAKADQYHAGAINALKSGNEEDAKKLLEQEEKYRSEAENYGKTASDLGKKSDVMQKKVDAMKEGIEDAEAIYREAKVNVKVADAAQKVNSAKFDDSALQRFNQLAEKSRHKYETMMAMDDMEDASDSGDDLLDKYATGTTDAKLAALKKELGME